jgi:glycyl-radical enzyme activating protein
MYSRQKCRYIKSQCRRCLAACSHGAITETGDELAPLSFDYEICSRCEGFECAGACPHDSARASGSFKTVDEVMKTIRRDRQYWSEDGGVSFSGGEPLVQHKFLKALLRAIKGEGMHTAIETTAYAKPEVFMDIMSMIDFAFIDLKVMDPVKHEQTVGVGNALILDNIRSLVASDWPGRLIFRMPVIEGFNDDLENAAAVADFMDSIGQFEINLLPFHRLATSKWEQIGSQYSYADYEPTKPEVLEKLQCYYLDRRIAAYVGEEVMY